MASDIRAQFEKVVEGMDWGEVVSTLSDLFGGDPPVPTLLSLPPTPTPTEPEQTDLPQLVYTVPHKPTVMAPPFFVKFLPSASKVCEAQEAPAQEQEPSDDQHSIVLSDTYNPDSDYNEGQRSHRNNMHMSVAPLQMNQNLRPVGYLNGELVYEISDVDPCVYEPPPPYMYNPKKKKRDEQNDSGTYIKKPLNAFMIYRKEERENVMAELKITDSAAVNMILGRRWKSMSKQEQAKYYLKAENEKQLHAQQYPNWSAVCNYGKRRRYDRSKAKPTATVTGRSHQTRMAEASWKSMSKQEQAKYYLKAENEKQLHAQQYPNWSAVRNYDKRRRCDRSKGKPTATVTDV